MRLMFGLTVLAATIAVAGCKSDETRMAEARKQVGDMCRSSPPPGLDAERYCTCVVDKSIGSKSAAEMRKMNEKDGEQLGMKAATECLAQMGIGGPQMGAAPGAPAATPGAPAAEVPAEAADKAGEAVEEGVDEAN